MTAPELNFTRLELPTRKRPKALFYLSFMWGFWLLWTPLTLVALWLFFHSWNPCFAAWLIFGILGVLGIPLFTWNEINASYFLTARPEGLEVVQPRRWFYRRELVPRQFKMQLFLGKHDEENVVSLNILWFKGRLERRIMLAAFASAAVQAELFDQIAAFLQNNAFEFEAVKTV